MLLRGMAVLLSALIVFLGLLFLGRFMIKRGIHKHWYLSIIIVIIIISAICFFIVFKNSNRRFITLLTIAAIAGWGSGWLPVNAKKK